jgi:hypothetical protein
MTVFYISQSLGTGKILKSSRGRSGMILGMLSEGDSAA